MSDKKKIVDQDLIRELADLLTETGLTEIEIEHDDTRIRVARNVTTVAAPAPAPMIPQAPSVAKLEAVAPNGDLSTHAGAVLSPSRVDGPMSTSAIRCAKDRRCSSSRR
jgi:acetyl-CoA carboxylase biotin carboxyl carrier protein